MDADKLIELVREFPILYDLTQPKYSDSRAKERVWRRIAERMKEPEAACRKTWSNLREAYRRAIKRRKNASDQATVNIRKWRYEDEMAFLNRYYKERPTRTTVTSDDTEDTTLERDISEMADIASPGTPNASRAELASPKFRKLSPVPRKKRRVKETRSDAATVLDYFIEDNKEKEADEVEQFCRCIGTMLRKFSPYELATAKKEIFSIISEVEFRQLRGSGASSFAEHLKDGNL